MTDEPTTEDETHRPNEFGGDPSVPEPAPGHRADEVDGEDIAVPAGDLTGAITGALENATGENDEAR